MKKAGLVSGEAASGWLLTQLLAGSLFIRPFLFCRVSHTFSPKAHIRCKEQSGLAESRNESNVGQDSAEATGNGASKRVRRQDPGQAEALASLARTPFLRINTLCAASVHTPPQATGCNSQDPNLEIKQNARTIQWDDTDGFHRLQAASSWPRKPSEDKGPTQP